jgi:ribosomal protein S6
MERKWGKRKLRKPINEFGLNEQFIYWFRNFLSSHSFSLKPASFVTKLSLEERKK